MPSSDAFLANAFLDISAGVKRFAAPLSIYLHIFAPAPCATMTLAPTEHPSRRLSTRFVIDDVHPIAPIAFAFPENCPSMI